MPWPLVRPGFSIRILMLLYAIIIFLSAFLLFQVQPIIAKIILPWFGGSAAVWTTCMLFFQLVLVLGYGYAHVVTRHLKARKQVWLHVGLLLASMVLLPVAPSIRWVPAGGEDPTLQILVLLGASVGLPFFLLSTSSPLLQAWFAQVHCGTSPYRLFALSNFGSMLALLSYPTVVEPSLATGHQARWWSVAYAFFVLLCLTAALVQGTRRSPPSVLANAKDDPSPVPPPTWRLHLFWLALAACASTLLLAVTNYLSQDVAAIPFLWILPLSLYLLSFILCFEGEGWYRRNIFLRLAALALVAMTYLLLRDNKITSLTWMIPVFSTGLFFCCMVCHGELARLKPPSQHLTGFYLMVATGGALGGLFVGVVAPRLFNGVYELPVGLMGCALLVLLMLLRELGFSLGRAWREPGFLLFLAVSVFLVEALSLKMWSSVGESRVMVRNFYGALRVLDSAGASDRGAVRKLVNGRITHGEQYLDSERRRDPITYFTRDSGVGWALLRPARPSPQRIGVIGLGAGTVASYGRPGDVYRFYEINPLVAQVAKSEFTFLKDCEARVEIVLGDARLSLEHEPDQHFDVLVVDAFTGDSIPAHLLTRQAFELYFRHLSPSGVLAVHVSNRYLDLVPVVQGAAESLGEETLVVKNEADDEKHIFGATWVLVTPERGALEKTVFEEVERSRHRRARRLWTDDYSNLLQVLK